MSGYAVDCNCGELTEDLERKFKCGNGIMIKVRFGCPAAGVDVDDIKAISKEENRHPREKVGRVFILAATSSSSLLASYSACAVLNQNNNIKLSCI